MSYIDPENLKYHVREGHITARRHPTLPYTVYNYAALTQFKKIWDNETLKSRGLVLDDDYNVVAVGFKKFFNWEEYPEGMIPIHLPFEATMKMDGSLLIIRNMGDHVVNTTRGSFESPQAAMGKHIIESKYGLDSLDPNYTYLFEVIYPENRIVCNYGYEDVVLLSMYDMRTFEEVPYEELSKTFPIVKRYDGLDIETMRTLDIANEEGFVIRFSNGFRAKIKFKTYMELHRIVTGISSRAVWELLKDGKSLDEVLEVIPDEFYDFVKKTMGELQRKYATYDYQTQTALDHLAKLGFETQKEKALWIQEHAKDVASFVFAGLAGKDYKEGIWKKIYPPYLSPFEERMRLTGEA